MQYDMHYYATYALAVAAGFQPKDAEVVAFSAQWVDDQNSERILVFEDLSGIAGTPTAHHPIEAGIRAVLIGEFDDSRQVWVPFHFLPGGVGDSFEFRLNCKKGNCKDNQIIRELLANHLMFARKDFGLHMAGITAHVYIDTFSHYGFSGINSNGNNVKYGSIEFQNLHESNAKELKDFWELNKHKFADSANLGHGGVGTNPDLPYLQWSFEYADGRKSGTRNNQATFEDGCKAVYDFFCQFVDLRYDSCNINRLDFEKLRPKIQRVLKQHLPADKRAELWMELMKNNSVNIPQCKVYYADTWTAPSNNEESLNSNYFRFHQAADIHRTYVLRELLPKHQLVVV